MSKYKDIKEEIKDYLFLTNLRWSKIHSMITNKIPINIDMRDEYEDLIKKTEKLLDSNTKRVKKESVETIKRTKYTKKDLKELAVTNMSTRIMKAHNKAIDEAIKAIK